MGLGAQAVIMVLPGRIITRRMAHKNRRPKTIEVLLVSSILWRQSRLYISAKKYLITWV